MRAEPSIYILMITHYQTVSSSLTRTRDLSVSMRGCDFLRKNQLLFLSHLCMHVFLFFDKSKARIPPRFLRSIEPVGDVAGQGAM